MIKSESDLKERKNTDYRKFPREEKTTEEITVALTEKKGNSVLDYIGNTPLLKIRNIVKEINQAVEVYAKAEWFNPGGSVKDRAALNMILQGEKSGELTKNKIIIDATSGNTGIAYALIGAVKGYKVKLALPANASPERKRILKAYNAELLLTDPLENTDGAQRIVKEIYQLNKDIYFYPDQYNNPANWQAHFKTADEIWKQTRGRITHFVAGLGTTGTFVGTARRLKLLNPDIAAVSFMPGSPLHGLEGLKHLPSAVVPGIYDSTIADRMIEVSTEEAYKMVKRLAREEGILAGLSSGAALVSCLKLAEELESGIIVTVFPDDGQKYLSDKLWEEK